MIFAVKFIEIFKKVVVAELLKTSQKYLTINFLSFGDIILKPTALK